MRFDDLFDDLESQLEAELGAERRDLEAEEERFRVGRLELHERIAAAPRTLDLTLRGGGRIRLRRMALGRDWLNGLVLEGAPADTGALVPLRAIAGIELDADGAAASVRPQSAGDLSRRLSFAFALRDLARRRAHVILEGPHPLSGTIDRVGRDHLDLALHEPGASPRLGTVRSWRIVPFDAFDWVRLP
ncbi:hypothetical protein LG314_09680 [Agrococcus terreus]|uniref:Uncharacterized protein n=1 Tax=Agrococcus terreus TaxID=574649 RepID=A0ABQ2KEX6_9MICO|nr:hypothetical protein [Agrococcus terreus]GGN80717.1 hypothetical protein GCM10010968_08840 [Agrococcus terreus]